VWHTTKTTGATNGILDNGIDPAFLNPNSRFRSAFYVAEQPQTSLTEMAHYGVDPTTGVRFSVDQSAINVLDLTDPNIASSWGYSGGPITSATRQIGLDAADSGDNAIRYFSERAPGGTNLAILNNYNSILKPVMISPVTQ
jgi:filamentous hemagglutinin